MARGLPAFALAVAGSLCAFSAGAAPEWAQPFAEVGTIRIVTLDPDGDVRDLPIWIVVLDEAAYIRTNDSRWLANIRRGSLVDVRTDDLSVAVEAREVDDDATYDAVEEAFKAKYGLMQRVMSFFRFSRPTVLALSAAPEREPLAED